MNTNTEKSDKLKSLEGSTDIPFDASIIEGLLAGILVVAVIMGIGWFIAPYISMN